MKNLIEPAGFKNQKELAKHLEVTEHTMGKWVKNPPKVFVEWMRERLNVRYALGMISDNERKICLDNKIFK